MPWFGNAISWPGTHNCAHLRTLKVTGLCLISAVYRHLVVGRSICERGNGGRCVARRLEARNARQGAALVPLGRTPTLSYRRSADARIRSFFRPRVRRSLLPGRDPGDAPVAYRRSARSRCPGGALRLRRVRSRIAADGDTRAMERRWHRWLARPWRLPGDEPATPACECAPCFLGDAPLSLAGAGT